nr:putative EF-hand domain pair, reverse transcriptase, RNA-dependent DNA polymerase [Tanacetum cinerariifolium]
MPTPKAQKIRPKYVDCIFIGYAKNSGAYHFIVHDSKNLDIQKNAVMESMNASFFENIFPCLMKEAGSSSRLDEEVVQDKRQRDDSDLHDERQDQFEEEEVEPMILAIAALRNLEVHQMDVKTTFLNGDLKEEIYMNQPKSFIAPGQEGKVCMLVKSLYDLNNDKMIKSTKDMLKSKFDMKDMGLVDVILDIKIIRTHNGLVLSQAHYVDKILNTHNAGDSGLARASIDTSLHLSKNRGVGGATISWKSSKQTVIAKSTMESEFIALDKCKEEDEITYMRKKWGHFEGNYRGAIPKRSCKTRLVFMDHNEHDCFPNVVNMGSIPYINVVTNDVLIQFDVPTADNIPSDQVGHEAVAKEAPLSYANKFSPTFVTKVNLRKLDANVPKDADFDIWLSSVFVNEKKYGLEKVTLVKGFFFFKFSSIDGFDSALREGDDCPKSPKRVVNRVEKGKGESSRADDEGFTQVKKKKSAGTRTVSLSNSFDALNDDKWVITEVKLVSKDFTPRIQVEGQSYTPVDKINRIELDLMKGKCVLVSDDGKPLKNVDSLADHDSNDEVASVDNDMALDLTSNPLGSDMVQRAC